MNFGNHEPRETVHGREKYKWVLLMFLFAPFVHKVMPIAEVAEAQAILERGENRGKVVLLV